MLATTAGAVAILGGALAWRLVRAAATRRALAASEAQLRAMLGASPVGIVLVELPSGRVLEGGDQLARMLKRPLPRTMSLRWQDEWVSYHADGSRVAAREYPMARMILDGAEAPELEVQHRRGDGVLTWIRIMGRAIHDRRGRLVGGVLAFVDIDAERRAQEDALRLADEFKTLADNIPILCWMAGPDGRIYWFNQRWWDYIGASPKIEGRPDAESIHDPEHLPMVRDEWRRARETGTPFECTFPMRGADGEYRPFLTRAAPIHDKDGRIVRWFGVNIEVSEQKRHEQQLQLLINELNHRVKNTLATIQSIAAQTVRNGKEPREIFQAFESRLVSLSDAHNLLTQKSWEGADVAEIVQRATRPFEADDRHTIESGGPAVWLRAESALGLAMALHELATNAVKYGALSAEDGTVSVRWSYDPATYRFQLDWIEAGGPAVEPPDRRGFGLRLVQRALGGETGAETEVSFRPEGLHCRLTATLPPVAQPDAA
jgi:PAS domain S-box-containing protein